MPSLLNVRYRLRRVFDKRKSSKKSKSKAENNVSPELAKDSKQAASIVVPEILITKPESEAEASLQSSNEHLVAAVDAAAVSSSSDNDVVLPVGSEPQNGGQQILIEEAVGAGGEEVPKDNERTPSGSENASPGGQQVETEVGINAEAFVGSQVEQEEVGVVSSRDVEIPDLQAQETTDEARLDEDSLEPDDSSQRTVRQYDGNCDDDDDETGDEMDRKSLELSDIIHERPLSQIIRRPSISSIADSVSDYDNHSIRASIDGYNISLYKQIDPRPYSLPPQFPDTPPQSPTLFEVSNPEGRSIKPRPPNRAMNRHTVHIETVAPPKNIKTENSVVIVGNGNDMPPTPDTPGPNETAAMEESRHSGGNSYPNLNNTTSTPYMLTNRSVGSRSSITYITYPSTVERKTTYTSTVEKKTAYTRLIFHQVSYPQKREIVNRETRGEIHSYEIKLVIQPVVRREYLPPRHVARGENEEECEVSGEEAEKLGLPVMQITQRVKQRCEKEKEKTYEEFWKAISCGK